MPPGAGLCPESSCGAESVVVPRGGQGQNGFSIYSLLTPLPGCSESSPPGECHTNWGSEKREAQAYVAWKARLDSWTPEERATAMRNLHEGWELNKRLTGLMGQAGLPGFWDRYMYRRPRDLGMDVVEDAVQKWTVEGFR